MGITVCDLFAGCGGLSLGLTQAGLDVRWAVEWDKDAASTYRASHPKTRVWCSDANDFLRSCVNGEEGTPQPGEVDLLAGGPPCQGFSGYNRYRSLDDPRNSLVETFLSFVEFLNPAFVLLENVPGMLQMEHGHTPKLLLNTLAELGYQSRLGILQAGSYGLPQNRWRVFIMAARAGCPIPLFPDPTHSFPRTTLFGATAYRECIVTPTGVVNGLFGSILPNNTVGDAIRDLPQIENGGGFEIMDYNNIHQSLYQQSLRNGSTQLYDHQADNHGPIMMARILAVPKRPGAGWLDLPKELQPNNLAKHGDRRYDNRFGRLWWDGIFNTIVTLPYPYWGRFIHPEQDRVLSVRECARAQGFPDNIRFYGKPKTKYRQVGNAVSPIVARKLGEEIIRTSFNK